MNEPRALDAAPENVSLTPHDEAAVQRACELQAAAARLTTEQLRYLLGVDPPAETRVSLKAWFGALTFAGLICALGRRLSPPSFAGLCGLATLLYPLFAFMFGVHESPRVKLFGWTLLLTYLAACAYAAATNLAPKF